MNITPIVQKLITLSENLESNHLSIMDIDDQLIEPFVESKYNLVSSLFNNRITIKLIYSKIDSSEKYGKILYLLLLDNKPIFFYTRSGTWLTTYVIYHINNEYTKTYIDFLYSCLEEDHKLLYLTDKKLLSSEWFGNYGLFEKTLPIVEKENY